MKYSKIFLVTMLSLLFLSCSEDDAELKLKLDKSEMTIEVGEVGTIQIIQAAASEEIPIWDSNDESVATVFMGSVTALSSGTAIISVTLGDEVATCEVTVPEREYQLVWSDEFDGNSLNMDNWTIEVNGNGGGNQEAQYYTDRPENIRVENGLLTIEAHKEDYEGKDYTSGRIITRDKQDFKYGKVEARLKVPAGKGTWPAFWMLGYGSWPRAGEIDIMEHVGYDPYNFHCALHSLNKNGMNGLNPSGHQTMDEPCADDFHVITMEWVENEFMGYDRIHIYVDGVLTRTFAETAQLQDSGDWPFNEPFFIILNLAIGGTWGGSQGIDDSMFDNPVLYQIDYVRVYQYQ